MRPFAAQLVGVEQFVDAGCRVGDETKRLGARWGAVALRFEDGAIALWIDNATDLTDDDRLGLLGARGDLESLLQPRQLATAPLVGGAGTFGAVLADAAGSERDLAVLATHLSVWCVQHGVGAVPAEPARDRLGPRQHQIARLATRGLGNGAIAADLGISVNTVKARLKEVFTRLGVRNRTELVHAVPRLTPLEGVAPGITRLSTCTLARAVHRR